MAIGKIIAVVAGVAVGGVAAYNYTTTGCPLGTGSCSTDGASAAMATVAAEGKTECGLCPSDAGAEVVLAANTESSACGATEACKDAEACDASTCELAEACCAAGKEAQVTMVANTEAAEGCCSEAAAEACSEKAEACTEKAEACTDAAAASACCASKGETEQVAKND